MATVEIRGLRELDLLAASKGREARLTLNRELRSVAEPIRRDAETLAATKIRRIGPNWSKMRVGVTQRLVYVAPRQRGVKSRGFSSRRRPKFATLMEQRAMTPALTSNSPFVRERVDKVMTRLVEDWNRL